MCTTSQVNAMPLCFDNGAKTACSKTTTLLPEIDLMNQDEFSAGHTRLAAVLILEKATFCEGSDCTVAKRAMCFVCKEHGRNHISGGIYVKLIRDNCYASKKRINCKDLSATSCLSKKGGGCQGFHQDMIQHPIITLTPPPTCQGFHQDSSGYSSTKTMTSIGASLEKQLEAFTMTA